MKLTDLKPLNESVTFNAVSKVEGKDYYSARYKKVTKPCWVCDGKGYEEYGAGEKHPCQYCHGKKTIEEEEDEGPELNVANANAALIVQMLGFTDSEDVSGGHLYNKDIPNVLQRLLRLKNSDGAVDAYTRPDEVHKGQMGVDRSGEVPRIGRQGPTIHSMGVDSERAMRYVDQMIGILKYAKDNGMDVSWG